MNITSFKTNHWDSRLWRIKAIYRAMIFAYKHPRHAQVSIEFNNKGFDMKANFAGINEKGFHKVIQFLGRESSEMEKTEQDFKRILEVKG